MLSTDNRLITNGSPGIVEVSTDRKPGGGMKLDSIHEQDGVRRRQIGKGGVRAGRFVVQGPIKSSSG